MLTLITSIWHLNLSITIIQWRSTAVITALLYQLHDMLYDMWTEGKLNVTARNVGVTMLQGLYQRLRVVL